MNKSSASAQGKSGFQVSDQSVFRSTSVRSADWTAAGTKAPTPLEAATSASEKRLAREESSSCASSRCRAREKIAMPTIRKRNSENPGLIAKMRQSQPAMRKSG
jgi:hypothetical protein